MNKIVIIEDEPDVQEELSLLLQNAGYETVISPLPDPIPYIKEQEPDLILLDVNLPGQDGFSICARIRSFSSTPIIFITGRNTSMDELKALTMGGDDFISKPYNIPVLMARISAVLKRSVAENSVKTLAYKGLELNLLSATLSYEDKNLELSKKELQILYYLFRNSGEIVSRMDLIEHLWKHQIYTDDNVLSVNITRIREKLKYLGLPDFIQTKRGMGYKI